MNLICHWATAATLALFFAQNFCRADTNRLELAIRSFPEVTAWKYRPDIAAEAADTLILAGSNGTCAVLESLAMSKPTLNQAEAGSHERLNRAICHLCRLIFSSSIGSSPLRPPRLGAFQELPYESMDVKEWPYLPFAIVDNIPICVSRGYVLAGIPETAASYLKYCRSYGVFRSTPFATATHKSAGQALQQLFGSSAWEKMKWKDSGPNWSYDINEDFTKEILQMQVELIPER